MTEDDVIVSLYTKTHLSPQRITEIMNLGYRRVRKVLSERGVLNLRLIHQRKRKQWGVR